MARILTGKVVSNMMDKTVVVAVEGLKTHPLYKKQYKTTARFKAHDESNALAVGTSVEITETRPMSRDKRFIVTKTLDAKATTKPAAKKAPSKPAKESK